MSVSCSSMDMWLIFLMLTLLTRFSHRGSLEIGGQWADHMPRDCSRLISISSGGVRPGICLGNGQKEAPRVPAESGCIYVLLWRMLPYLS